MSYSTKQLPFLLWLRRFIFCHEMTFPIESRVEMQTEQNVALTTSSPLCRFLRKDIFPSTQIIRRQTTVRRLSPALSRRSARLGFLHARFSCHLQDITHSEGSSLSGNVGCVFSANGTGVGKIIRRSKTPFSRITQEVEVV